MNYSNNIATQSYMINDARSRVVSQGVEQLSDVELIALMLRGAGERTPFDKAVTLLNAMGSLRKVLTADYVSMSAHGITESQFVILQSAMELTRRHYRELMTVGPALTSPRATRDYLRMRLRDLEHEVFGIIYLDNRNRVIACEELFRGANDGATVHPRECVKAALAKNAAAVLIFHNHPSGISSASQADELITRKLKDAFNACDIRLLDHLIVGDGDVESFAERGLL